MAGRPYSRVDRASTRTSGGEIMTIKIINACKCIPGGSPTSVSNQQNSNTPFSLTSQAIEDNATRLSKRCKVIGEKSMTPAELEAVDKAKEKARRVAYFGECARNSITEEWVMLI